MIKNLVNQKFAKVEKKFSEMVPVNHAKTTIKQIVMIHPSALSQNAHHFKSFRKIANAKSVRYTNIFQEIINNAFLNASAHENVPPAGYSPATCRLPVGFSLCVATLSAHRQTLGGSNETILCRLGANLEPTCEPSGAD